MCINWLSNAFQKLSYSAFKIVLEKCVIIVSFLSGSSIPDLGGVDEESMKPIFEKDGFPLDSSWQPNEYRPLSIKAYNLAIACNVSLFSGWETEEYNQKDLNRKYGNKHFGVHLRGRRLIGCLPEHEKMISRLWKKFEQLEPHAPKLPFEEKVKEVKDAEWFQNANDNDNRPPGNGTVVSYAEKDALRLFLSYTALCFHMAGAENDKKLANRYQQLALSVLIPVVSTFRFEFVFRNALETILPTHSFQFAFHYSPSFA
jgi:hypothetical protein